MMWAVLVTILGHRTLYSQGILSGREFTQAAIRYLNTQQPEWQVEEISEFLLKCRDTTGIVTTVSLRNAYSEYKSGIAPIDSVFNRYLILEQFRGESVHATDFDSILPVLRPRAYYDDLCRQLAGHPKNALAVDTLNSELVVLYVRDFDGHMSFITMLERSALVSNNVIFREVALSNLRKKFPEVTMFRQNGFVMVVTDGNYESSLPLLDEYCEPVAYGLTGRLVMAVPSRDLFLVTDESNLSAITAIQQIAKGSDSLAYKITDKLFIRDSGRWKEHQPAK